MFVVDKWNRFEDTSRLQKRLVWLIYFQLGCHKKGLLLQNTTKYSYNDLWLLNLCEISK